MDCKKIQNKIDELAYDMSIQLDLKEQAHLDECENCRKYYADALKATKLLHEIQQREPVLDDPEELTESIMKSIQDEAQEYPKAKINYRIIIRVLAAAVVALLLTLEIEQYRVLNKIQLLETKLGKVQQTHQNQKYLINEATLIDLSILFKDDNHDGFSLEKVSTLFILNRIKHSNFTLSDLNRYMNKDDFLKSSQKKTTQ